MANDVNYDREKSMAEVREFLPGYFNADVLPEDEEELCAFIRDKFRAQRQAYAELEKKYGGNLPTQAEIRAFQRYPGSRQLKEALDLTDAVLRYEKSDDMLLFTVAKLRNELSAAKERMQPLKHFFKEEAALYDRGKILEHDTWWTDMDCYRLDAEAGEYFKRLEAIYHAYDFKDFARLKELMEAIEARAEVLRLGKYEETMKIIEESRNKIKALIKTPESGYIAEAAEHYFLDMEMLLKYLLEDRHLLTWMDAAALNVIRFREKTVSRMAKAAKPESREGIIHCAEKFAAGYFRTAETWTDEEDLPRFIRKGIEGKIKEYSGFRYPAYGKPYAYLRKWALGTLHMLRKTEDDYEMMALLPLLGPILKRAGNRIMILKALVNTEAFLEEYETEIPENEKSSLEWVKGLWQHAWYEQEYNYLNGRLRGYFRLLGRKTYYEKDMRRCFKGIERLLCEIDECYQAATDEKELELNGIWINRINEIKKAAKGHLSDERIERFNGGDYGDGEMPLRVMDTAFDWRSPGLMDGLLMRILRYNEQEAEKIRKEINGQKE